MTRALLMCAVLTACSAPATPPAPKPAPPVSEPAKPRVVLAVVIDQLASWTFEKYLPYLPEGGALRTGIARGSFIERVRYAYASTNTAPGHASIFTGAPPAVSGITSNSRFDQATGKEQPFVSDGRHPVFGRPEASASPLVLRVDTVGDVLERQTGDRARVASLSVKDRSAVVSGGKSADMAVWYDHRIKRFTTSSYYGPEPPEWLERWQAAHPLDALLGVWEPLDRELTARAAGNDDAAGEGDWLGLGRTFPHRVGEAKDPYEVLRATPMLTEYLLALAQEAARALDMGSDDVVDLLIVSISGTDYAGHAFGPDSWEYFDNLVRADRALAVLVRALEARGPVAVLVTSDHGVARLPEQSGEGGRIFPSDLLSSADNAAREVADDRAGWVRAFVRPFFYLAAELDDDMRARVKRAVIARISALPGIELVVDVDEGRRWSSASDPLKRAVALSLAEGTPGDLYVMPKAGWVVDEDLPRGAGTTHGTPWPFDAEVPVIFWGAGVSHHREHGPLEQRRVAATLAALLGVPPPSHLHAAPLPGL